MQPEAKMLQFFWINLVEKLNPLIQPIIFCYLHCLVYQICFPNLDGGCGDIFLCTIPFWSFTEGKNSTQLDPFSHWTTTLCMPSSLSLQCSIWDYFCFCQDDITCNNVHIWRFVMQTILVSFSSLKNKSILVYPMCGGRTHQTPKQN